MESWPSISIVTPSFNQADYLEAAIRSVLLQGYPHIEYAVVDGGSTDRSREILQKYHPYFAYCRSEPDRGQSEAINHGFSRLSGAIMGWLNSDDIYEPGTLYEVAHFFLRDQECHWVTGGLRYVDSAGKDNGAASAFSPTSIARYRLFDDESRYQFSIHQPATFWSRRMWMQCGPLDEQLHYGMDRLFWMKAMASGYSPVRLDRVLASFRKHSSSKSTVHPLRFAYEGARIHFRLAWQPGFRRGANLLVAARLILRGMKGQLLEGIGVQSRTDGERAADVG